MKVWPGSPYRLGATWDGSGVNFALVLWRLPHQETHESKEQETNSVDHRPSPAAS